MTFSYRKFPDGSWTVVAPINGRAKLSPGDQVSVTTRGGKERTEIIKAFLVTLDDGRHVYSVEPRRKDPDAKAPDLHPFAMSAELLLNVKNAAAGFATIANNSADSAVKALALEHFNALRRVITIAEEKA